MKDYEEETIMHKEGDRQNIKASPEEANENIPAMQHAVDGIDNIINIISVKTESSIDQEMDAGKMHEEISCDQCGELFSLRSNLSRHKKTMHNKAVQFNCSECSKSFSRKDKLTAHSKCHTGESQPSFACDACSKSYYRKDHLKRHRRKGSCGG